MAFSNQIQHRFAGFEENLNLPALSINTDNLFFGKGRICTDKSKPVLAIRFVPYANDFRFANASNSTVKTSDTITVS